MAVPTECLRCKSTMSAGFILDRANQNMGREQEWVEGPPDHSFWRGLKTKGHDSYKVTTYRCDRCGYLESFAVEHIDG